MRVPFVDLSTYAIPDGVSDEDVLMMADILPTGYEVGVLNGARAARRRRRRGRGRAVGLSAITGARLFSPVTIIAVDLADSRLTRRNCSVPT